METYSVSCKTHTKNRNSNVQKTKQNRLMLLGCLWSEKSPFTKNKELHNFD